MHTVEKRLLRERITRDPLPGASKVTRARIDVRLFGTMCIENYYEVSVLK